MTRITYSISDYVRNRALLDDAGTAWLDSVGQTLAEIAANWSLEFGTQMAGGTEALVFQVRRADGSPAVLKVTVPGNLGNEPRVLASAEGRGYAKLYEADLGRNALLLEQLGNQLKEDPRPLNDHIAIICETLEQTWQITNIPADLPTGAAKAQWLADYIEEQWEALGQPFDKAIRNRAIDYAKERIAAHNPAHCVLVHGDAHVWNTLRASGETASGLPAYKFVDPDGMLAEKAADLCISLREWTDELLAGDTLALGQERCQLISDISGVPCEPIWQWGFVEHISSGLLWLQMNNPTAANAHFEIGKIWLDA